ncbi:hypothetical protein [Sphingomonas sp. 37zxx]|uniref:hypothetical protein n=1 Tax=Sphingomonas sp. 37zxx TaxID=1550073 RepID=UPI000AF9DF34|nr:hypothetical protein [Sphingomonas sp. 37zxx]
MLGVGGVAALRYGWSQPKRSAAINALGWAALIASVGSGWLDSGAWGVAVAALVTMTAAFTALAIAAARSPQGRAASPSRRAGMLPPPGEPRRIGRRVATFVMVVPGGFFASVALALSVRGFGMWLGWGEANANVAALYTVPITWAMLATALLMQTRRRSQITTLLACMLAAIPFVPTGLGS